MGNWFEVKVSYEKMLENGMQKKVTEPYLVDALSFTEAESRAIEELKPYISGEFTVAAVGRKKISELFFYDPGNRFFMAKVAFVTVDEKSGAEKESKVQMIAQASDINEALLVVKKGMEGTMADYRIINLGESAIVDVFPYSEDSKKSIVLN